MMRVGSQAVMRVEVVGAAEVSVWWGQGGGGKGV